MLPPIHKSLISAHRNVSAATSIRPMGYGANKSPVRFHFRKKKLYICKQFRHRPGMCPCLIKYLMKVFRFYPCKEIWKISSTREKSNPSSPCVDIRCSSALYQYGCGVLFIWCQAFQSLLADKPNAPHFLCICQYGALAHIHTITMVTRIKKKSYQCPETGVLHIALEAAILEGSSEEIGDGGSMDTMLMPDDIFDVLL